MIIRRHSLLWLAFAGILSAGTWQLAATRAHAEDPPQAKTEPAPGAAPAEPALSQEELEQRFTESMTGVQMIGSFTLTGAPADKAPSEDKYTINKVKKLKNDFWLFDATIQYGGNNTRIPISLPVKWAGDTPVITVNNVLVPGMGSFTARVLIYKDQYAGTWSGGDHGGAMYGRIVKLGAEDPAAAKNGKAEEKKADDAKTDAGDGK